MPDSVFYIDVMIGTRGNQRSTLNGFFFLYSYLCHSPQIRFCTKMVTLVIPRHTCTSDLETHDGLF